MYMYTYIYIYVFLYLIIDGGAEPTSPYDLGLSRRVAYIDTQILFILLATRFNRYYDQSLSEATKYKQL